MEAKTKHQKSDTIETVIQKVRTNGGSFLRKDPVHNHWFHVDEIKARDKVCQSPIFRRPPSFSMLALYTYDDGIQSFILLFLLFFLIVFPSFYL